MTHKQLTDEKTYPDIFEQNQRGEGTARHTIPADIAVTFCSPVHVPGGHSPLMYVGECLHVGFCDFHDPRPASRDG
jgi:hypothetical protein